MIFWFYFVTPHELTWLLRGGFGRFFSAKNFYPYKPVRLKFFFQWKSRARIFFGRLSTAGLFFFASLRTRTALPISKQQKSYPKDSMDTINFIKMSPSGRHTKTCFNGRNQSLYEHTKEEETHTVCSRAYETVYVNKPSGMHPNNTTGTIAKATRSRSL